MALSPSHRFGQIIGEVLEGLLLPQLRQVAEARALYLDWQHKRPARANKSKVAWVDGRGNSHDLDYVLEQGGSETVLGQPKAFIEMAWRRYTKHSRNKAQEIQAAIPPLAERYADAHPFLGVVLAGVYTPASLRQLQSHGFQVLHIPYESVIAAFGLVGIDARFDEETADAHLRTQVGRYEKLDAANREKIPAHLRLLHAKEINGFVEKLTITLLRRVKSIRILALHGQTHVIDNVSDALAFIASYPEHEGAQAFVRYEVVVEYGNGDLVRGQFAGKAEASSFLRVLDQV